MDNSLQTVQKLALDILLEFDKFCKAHHLVYYITCGTLLGAVRHGGFIPWDDDIDVSMPREDYDKLLLTYAPLLPPHLALQHHNNTPAHPFNFAKIVNKNTTVVEQNGQSHYAVRGAFIDIFPIDGAGDTYPKAVRRRKLATPYRKLIALSSYIWEDETTPLWKKALIRMGKHLNTRKWQNKLDDFLRKKPYAKSRYVAVYVGFFGLREIMEKEVYGKPSQIEFCGYSFYAPAKPEAYLTSKYGNFMQLPPEEKRVSHHRFVYIDAHTPFETFDPATLKPATLKKE